MAVYDWQGTHLKARPNVRLVTGVSMPEYLRMLEHSLQ
jgi:hypothetical protein